MGKTGSDETGSTDCDCGKLRIEKRGKWGHLFELPQSPQAGKELRSAITCAITGTSSTSCFLPLPLILTPLLVPFHERSLMLGQVCPDP